MKYAFYPLFLFVCRESKEVKEQETLQINDVSELNKHMNDDFDKSQIKNFYFQNEGKKLYDKGLELLGQFINKFQNNLYELKLNLQRYFLIIIHIFFFFNDYKCNKAMK